MGGGLMQLVAYGAQDIYLTGNPQITFFKTIYKRHTNFSMEHIQQTFQGNPGPGARVVATVSRNGDLIHDCYIKLNINCISGGEEDDQAVLNPGHNILNNIELEIGGQLIDRQYGHFMEAHAELTEESNGYFSGDPNTYYGADLSLFYGNTNELNVQNISPFQLTSGAGGILVPRGSLVTDDTDIANLYVPLRFWFCRHIGLSLPLIALQYHEVNINITFSNIYPLINVYEEPELWVNYIYLDTDERRRFAQLSHEYLIEQVQTQEFSWTEQTGSDQRLKLNFNHPVKELIWGVTQDNTLYDGWGGVFGGSFSTFHHTSSGGHVDTKCKLILNGQDRFDEQDIDYFTRYQPYKYHKNLSLTIKTDTIGVYSFALRPEEHQPSGTCNFSRIDFAVFEIKSAGGYVGTPITTVLQMYAINYNVLRIMSGMGGLAYSN